MHFALNRVRIERFENHSPNQTPLNLPPERLLPLYITITRQVNKASNRSEIKTGNLMNNRTNCVLQAK